jgi:hypothetical protein
MKTLLVIVLLFVAHFSFAKIWIVDSNAGSTAKDFTNLQAAHDGATAGDTLYLIGSPVNYITVKVYGYQKANHHWSRVFSEPKCQYASQRCFGLLK